MKTFARRATRTGVKQRGEQKRRRKGRASPAIVSTIVSQPGGTRIPVHGRRQLTRSPFKLEIPPATYKSRALSGEINFTAARCVFPAARRARPLSRGNFQPSFRNCGAAPKLPTFLPSRRRGHCGRSFALRTVDFYAGHAGKATRTFKRHRCHVESTSQLSEIYADRSSLAGGAAPLNKS